MGTDSAGRRLARTDLILRGVAEQISERADLHRLCAVSRHFHAAFTPFLYAQLELYTTYDAPDSMAHLARNPHLRHVRSLRCAPRDIEDERAAACDLVGQMRALLPAMPRLTRFVWIDMPLRADTLAQLKTSCPALTQLDITYDSDMEMGFLGIGEWGRALDEPVAPDNPYAHQDVAAFAGAHLTRLSLLGLYHELSVWRAQLVQVLRQSPNLVALGLSMAEDTAFRYQYQDVGGGDVNVLDYLADLCTAYAAQPGTTVPPLSLAELHLGVGMYLWKDNNRLALLTNPARLERVHVENRGMEHVGEPAVFMYEDGEDSFLDFGFFSRENCPWLRRFSVYKARGDFRRWRRALRVAEPEWAAGLEVEAEEEEEDPEYDTDHEPEDSEEGEEEDGEEDDSAEGEAE